MDICYKDSAQDDTEVNNRHQPSPEKNDAVARASQVNEHNRVSSSRR